MESLKKVDINSAKLEDLESLTGVGHAKAESIIEHRKANGPYTSIGDLRKIPGIGPSILEQNKGILTCSSQASTSKASGWRETRRSARTEGIRSSCTLTSEDKPSAAPSTSTGRRSRNFLPDWRGTPRTRGAERRQQELMGEDSEEEEEEEQEDNTKDNHDHIEDTTIAHNDSYIEEEMDYEHDDEEEDGEEEEDQEYPYESEDTKQYEEEESMELGGGGGDGMPEGVVASLRSRTSTLSAAAQQMKRKCEGGGNKDMSPGKKPCRLSEDATHLHASSPSPSDCGSLVTSSCGGVGSPNHDPCSQCLHCNHCGQNSPPPPNYHQANMAMMRKRIPSKSNPPPELADWLKTYQEWTHAERMLAVDELIDMCEVTEVRHMMAVIEPQFQRDFISLLPKELALHVLWYLEPRDLCRAAQTCRYWRILASDNLLWREKCKEETISESSVFENSLRKRNPCSKNPWKGLYLRQKDIEHRWRGAPIKDPKVLKGHDDHVITCLEFCGSRIVSGSDDNTLKVWSAVSGKCLRTLQGHTGGVWSSQMSGHTIISGSTDRTLRVWHADTGQCVHVLYGHTSTVRCMCLHINKVVSGSRDATLRMWDIESGECLHVLIGHMAAVRCVQYDGKKVVSGAYDNRVKIWDPETETCLHTLLGHTNRVYSLQFDGTHIVSGSLDTSIRVWDVETGQSLHTLIGHQSLTSGMELKDSILVSGNADSTVKVWDIRTGICLQTLQGPNKHQSAVTCLQFNRRFAVTSSDDGTVKLWSVKTGEFVRDLVRLESGGSGGVVWRLRCSNTKLVCAVGSRNGTEETKLLVLDFDVEDNLPLVQSSADRKSSASGDSNCSSPGTSSMDNTSVARRISLSPVGQLAASA